MTSEKVSLEPSPQPLFSLETPSTQQISSAVPRNPFINIQTLEPRGQLSEEIRAYHQEAENANELALRKQIETLKQLVADQAKNINNGWYWEYIISNIFCHRSWHRLRTLSLRISPDSRQHISLDQLQDIPRHLPVSPSAFLTLCFVCLFF